MEKEVSESIIGVGSKANSLMTPSIAPTPFLLLIYRGCSCGWRAKLSLQYKKQYPNHRVIKMYPRDAANYGIFLDKNTYRFYAYTYNSYTKELIKLGEHNK